MRSIEVSNCANLRKCSMQFVRPCFVLLLITTTCCIIGTYHYLSLQVGTTLNYLVRQAKSICCFICCISNLYSSFRKRSINKAITKNYRYLLTTSNGINLLVWWRVGWKQNIVRLIHQVDIFVANCSFVFIITNHTLFPFG